MDTFGDKLKDLRENEKYWGDGKKRHSQYDLSKKTGIPVQTIRKYEQDYDGKAKPSVKSIIAIANEFNISTDYLLGLTDEPSKEIKIKEISRIYGLSSKTLETLKYLNTNKRICQEETFDRNTFTYIQTINELIIGLYPLKDNNYSILSLIDSYLNIPEWSENQMIGISKDGILRISNDMDENWITIGNNILLSGILELIKSELYKKRLIKLKKANINNEKNNNHK